jgi:PAS domain
MMVAGGVQPVSTPSLWTAKFRAGIRHPRLIELFDYWDGLRRGREVPSRADFDPVDVPKLLPNLILNDVVGDPVRFRIRLEGTAVTDARQRSGTGRYLDEPGIIVLANGILERYHAMLVDRLPWYSEGRFALRDGRGGYLYRLALPLSPDDGAVTMILTGFYHELRDKG